MTSFPSIPYLKPDGYLQSQLRRKIAVALKAREYISPSERLLDFGCGDRPYEDLVVRSSFKYSGADLEYNTNADVQFSEGNALPEAEGVFSVVLSTQVLEHVWDIGWYLRECHRVLKLGGQLIFSTHGNWPYHPHPSDYRRWTSDGLRREI